MILTSILCQLGRPLCDVSALDVALSEFIYCHSLELCPRNTATFHQKAKPSIAIL